ncbi:MAG: hypothetical protein KDN05_01545 [Verrucomicrobiae bacterium]|nr:hypothetical protein [Verrucomicrobiae bacterium]MCP5532201.1 hypothetical protein [Akkermansiaceae bacterium]MCP5544264.1 hypothetical protein [Akkermansiaceae bacterium]MCP5547012.1 hypothetical protein [Akkermansiaceae bacterium]
MPPEPNPAVRFPWTRFWSPRKTRDHGNSSEFLEDPLGEFGKHLHPKAAPLADITPETGLLVLCGEPGLGKTYEMDLLRERLAASTGGKNRLMHLKAREFESFPDLQSHFDGHPDWQAWLTDSGRLSVLLDGLDEGLIRMPTLVARLRSFLENKPADRLKLVLSCRSFDWPEAEGNQLASLWKREETAEFIFELEPLRREDAGLAAGRRGHDGEKFLEAVHRADVASLASRPITLFFLLDEFHGEGFQATSRTQLYRNGCRSLCEESNPERARLLRRFSRVECSADEKVDASGKLACGLLLGGKRSIWFPTTSGSKVPSGNVCHAKDLIDCGLMVESAVEQALGTGVFTALGGDCYGFVHQTFAECLAGQTLSHLPLSQLRTFLCATDAASGNEYVIPQLVELSAWVAGDHPGFFAHLIDVDPAALLRSGLVLATPRQKAQLVARLLDLAGKNLFFDEYGYWRFWPDLKHPNLADQINEALKLPDQSLMVRRVAIDIAKACRLPELVPALFDILKAQDGDQYFRSSVAATLCACMPDDRLAELESLARGEVGPDPDQSILGHALQRLVPKHWSVADALPFIGRTKDSSHFGSYWGALQKMPKHLTDHDILPGLRAIQKWDGGFSSTSFRRDLSMALLTRALERIDHPLICEGLVNLWKAKARDFREFFRTGDREDSDFAKMKDEPRRKWIAAILESSTSESDESIDKLLWDTYRLIRPDDFDWLLENLHSARDDLTSVWAKAVQRMLMDVQIRVTWWDAFIGAYRQSPALRSQMAWLEETSINAPERRSAKARWLWHERRYDRLMKRHQVKRKLPDPKAEFDRATARVSAGESWQFMNVCWALSLDDEGHAHGHRCHDIMEYLQWSAISDEQRGLVRDLARQFLLDCSDGWHEHRARTNYSDPGVAAIWLLRDQIESDDELRSAVAAKWIEAIVDDGHSSEEHTKELFALAYRINPQKVIGSWMREIRRDLQRHGHPFAIRMADRCFDPSLADEITQFTKSLKDPKSLRMTIYELREIDSDLARGLASYFLRHALCSPGKPELASALIVAGMGTGSREIWRMAHPFLLNNPELARKIMEEIGSDADTRNSEHFADLPDDELGDLYLLLCRLFPPSEDPPEKSGWVSPRRSVVYLRGKVLGTLSARSTIAACNELDRLAVALPDQATWLQYRRQQTLSAVRRNEWQPVPLPDLGTVLAHQHKRFIRDNADLLNLVLESLSDLQRHLRETTLPAVEDLWQWEGAGLKRKNFRHKDEEAVSDYVARWLRDRIGPDSKVVVNREVQPRRGQRTDILMEAWSNTPGGRNRQEVPLSVTIEVKGCWNAEIRTGAKNQLLDGYLRPFGRTNGIFLVAWFYSPGRTKSESAQHTELRFEDFSEAKRAVASFVEKADAVGCRIEPFVLNCRLP